MAELDELTAAIRRFNSDRGWERFHDPKSLTLALVGEVGELAELVQWLPAESARELTRAEPLRTRLAEELSDVLIYLLNLADAAGIDLLDAATAKLDSAARKYPAAEYRDRAPDRH